MDSQRGDENSPYQRMDSIPNVAGSFSLHFSILPRKLVPTSKYGVLTIFQSVGIEFARRATTFISLFLSHSQGSTSPLLSILSYPVLVLLHCGTFRLQISEDRPVQCQKYSKPPAYTLNCVLLDLINHDMSDCFCAMYINLIRGLLQVLYMFLAPSAVSFCMGRVIGYGHEVSSANHSSSLVTVYGAHHSSRGCICPTAHKPHSRPRSSVCNHAVQ